MSFDLAQLPGTQFLLYDYCVPRTVDAVLRKSDGTVIFEQPGVRAPKAWSDKAVTMVASKYFRGQLGDDDREQSVFDVVYRVTGTIGNWAIQDGYLAEGAAQSFAAEISALCLGQYMAFNSPVWFNVGAREHPQCSACFINSVEDDMGSILDLAKTEGMIFKWGSGSGCNFSKLRAEGEPLTGGGSASGPVSFLRGLDAFAGIIKSGGQTRRAARMAILEVDHPDIVWFVTCKLIEEQKAHDLVEAGWPAAFDAETSAYASVGYQNTNHSVRVTDDFMKSAVDDDVALRVFPARWRKSRPQKRQDVVHDASELLDRLAESAWACGDPGLQFHDTINAWHGCSADGPIVASNPCGEFLFLDDSACNLASLGLLRFARIEEMNPVFDCVAFSRAVMLTVMAQDVLVDRAEYPTAAIGETSRHYRPLGLGYADLGALLMACGLPYDSDEGRALAAAITSLMTAVAWKTSALLAKARGPFDGYEKNKEGMLKLLAGHTVAHSYLDRDGAVSMHAERRQRLLATGYKDIIAAGTIAWGDASQLAHRHGLRNAQVTLLAPTGTVSIMMDCVTTGVEPEFALVKTKDLVGGGTLHTVNPLVKVALQRLNIQEGLIDEFVRRLETGAAGAWLFGPEEEPRKILACAYGENPIHWLGHLRMMEAVQPFLSGGISKTVGLPTSATMTDVREVFIEAWKRGIKSLTIYRDGCKASQPLNSDRPTADRQPPSTRFAVNTSVDSQGLDGEAGLADGGQRLAESREPDTEELRKLVRKHMPAERLSVTHKFTIGEHDGYMTVGLFDDGKPGELFVVMSKEGTVMSGLMGALTTAVSVALQYGVPLQVFCEKFAHLRFEPSGITTSSEPSLRFAKSIVDYIFRWLDLRFIQQPGSSPALVSTRNPVATVDQSRRPPSSPVTLLSPASGYAITADQMPCSVCGELMERAGSCYHCRCGASTGCG
jgi:ribonucleoside-diphosphate reductase alpha chain